ncbi:hypothetical protein FB451DRAFT_1165091 [Mycena latifolia]|nr:hypothetical protein FB451DRAFT_1165091 [Mycena latifolia]
MGMMMVMDYLQSIKRNAAEMDLGGMHIKLQRIVKEMEFLRVSCNSQEEHHTQIKFRHNFQCEQQGLAHRSYVQAEKARSHASYGRAAVVSAEEEDDFETPTTTSNKRTILVVNRVPQEQTKKVISHYDCSPYSPKFRLAGEKGEVTILPRTVGKNNLFGHEKPAPMYIVMYELLESQLAASPNALFVRTAFLPDTEPEC